jgi:hypothetical protein
VAVSRVARSGVAATLDTGRAHWQDERLPRRVVVTRHATKGGRLMHTTYRNAFRLRVADALVAISGVGLCSA